MLRPADPGGAGDGPDHGGVPRSVAVMGAAGVLPGHDWASDHPLRGVIVQRHHREVPVRGQAVPFAVQGGGSAFFAGSCRPGACICFFRASPITAMASSQAA